jgi:hypothetical protein
VYPRGLFFPEGGTAGAWSLPLTCTPTYALTAWFLVKHISVRSSHCLISVLPLYVHGGTSVNAVWLQDSECPAEVRSKYSFCCIVNADCLVRGWMGLESWGNCRHLNHQPWEGSLDAVELQIKWLQKLIMGPAECKTATRTSPFVYLYETEILAVLLASPVYR